MMMADGLTLDASGLSFTRDGYLVGDARISRAGNVQVYLGSEIGLTGDDAGKRFGVYRDPDVVFSEASMRSLAGRPVTRDHPPGGVSGKTWRDLAVGQVGGVIRRDGEHVVASVAIMDAAAAEEVANGARALSAGYTVEIVPDEGVAEDGTPYQFRQTGDLRFNHVAYLPGNNPRAGNTRIGDGAVSTEGKESRMADNLKTMVLGDAAIQVAAADADKIEAWKAAQTKALTDAAAAHDKAIAAKDAEIAAKDAEIADLKAKVLTDAALDARVEARAALVAKAKAMVKDFDTAGKSDADIRKAVVVARRGAAMADKSAAYIDAAFDLLAEEAPDPVRSAVKDARPEGDAYAEQRQRLADAWKTPVKEG